MTPTGDIASLVPHAGSMVLLDSVLDWDDATIRCRTESHRAPANPLRRDGMLASVCAIEYGAQAAAVHGALNDRRRGGYLAGVRDLRRTVERLDGIDAALVVTAERRLVEPMALIYDFRIDREDMVDAAEPLVAGRVTIMLDEETDG